MIMLALLEAGLGIEEDLESESELATDLSLNFTKGEELFFLALSRSKVRAIADLFAVGGGVDIFSFLQDSNSPQIVTKINFSSCRLTI